MFLIDAHYMRVKYELRCIALTCFPSSTSNVLILLCVSALRLNLDDLPTNEAEQEVLQEDDTPEIITMPSRFDQVQEKGYIDVWWLYDDGG